MSDEENIKTAMDALNSACGSKKYRSFKDIQPGEYIVNQFSMVDTTHGKRIRIELGDCYMLLPERFVKQLDQTKLDVLNKAPKIMIYTGKDSSQRDRLILEFRNESYFSDIFSFGAQ